MIMRPTTAIRQYGIHLSSGNRKAQWHYKPCEKIFNKTYCFQGTCKHDTSIYTFSMPIAIYT